jgi:hypothetical protein
MCAHQSPLARRWRSAEFIALLLAAGAGYAGEQAISPYTDPGQLDCPWPKMSHYKQPWRGFLETRSGFEFLGGLGVNLHIPPGTEDLAIRLLAETGFKTFRIEIGWGENVAFLGLTLPTPFMI